MTGRVGQSTAAAVARVPGKGGKGTAAIKSKVAIQAQRTDKRTRIDISKIRSETCAKVRAEIVRLWRAGLSQTAIALQVGYRPDSVRRIARQAGLIGMTKAVAGAQTYSLGVRKIPVTLPYAAELTTWWAGAQQTLKKWPTPRKGGRK